MYDILTLNKIAKCGTDAFDKAKYTVADAVENPDAIMVRSAAMHDMQFGNKLLAIARAGAGVNNIPVDRCAEEGIVVFNTPGANANAVKELVIAGLLLSSRKVTDAIDWVSTLKGQEDIGKKVEKGKSNFAGPEISGKTLGVIGLGVQIGTRFLASEECKIHENYKNAVVKAKDTDNAITGFYSGSPCRCIKSKYTKVLQDMEKKAAPPEDFEALTVGSLRKAVVDGNTDEGSMLCGLIAGMINDVKPCAEIVNDIVSQAGKLLNVQF